MGIKGRAGFGRSILAYQGWKWVFAAPFALFGAFQAVRDEFLSPELQEKLRLLNWLPDWPWEWWALGTLLIIFALTFEGAHRLNRAAQPDTTDDDGSPDWYELESRFDELGESLKWSRVSIQTGAAGEHLRLTGTHDRGVGQKFKALSQLAGMRLLRDFPDTVNTRTELESESNPVNLWWKALQWIGGHMDNLRDAHQLDDDGEPAGVILSNSIDNPAEKSAALCLAFASDVTARSENGPR